MAFQPTIRQQKIDIERGRAAQRRHERSVARISAGVQPNRTPGKALRARLGLSKAGGGGAKGLSQNAPPRRKKRG